MADGRCPLEIVSLIVQVPVDRYGQISLRQSIQATADSLLCLTLNGRLSFISDKAEFTPRNVQTKNSRVTTVHGVKLNREYPLLGLSVGTTEVIRPTLAALPCDQRRQRN